MSPDPEDQISKYHVNLPSFRLVNPSPLIWSGQPPWIDEIPIHTLDVPRTTSSPMSLELEVHTNSKAKLCPIFQVGNIYGHWSSPSPSMNSDHHTNSTVQPSPTCLATNSPKWFTTNGGKAQTTRSPLSIRSANDKPQKTIQPWNKTRRGFTPKHNKHPFLRQEPILASKFIVKPTLFGIGHDSKTKGRPMTTVYKTQSIHKTVKFKLLWPPKMIGPGKIRF